MSEKKSTSWVWALLLFAAGILIGFTSNPNNPFNEKDETAPISPYGEGAVYSELSTEQFSVRLSPEITKDLIEIINNMGLNKYAQGEDRQHLGDYPYHITMYHGKPEAKVEIHFNADFSRMWARDHREDKNSFSYEIDDPKEIRQFIADWESKFES